MVTIKSRIKQFSFIGYCVLFGAVQPLSAADKNQSKEIVVSASRIPVPANRVGSSVTVLTSNDIKRLQPANVAELLRNVPGVAVSQSGTRGGQTQVRIRGAEGNHTLVIVDGIEMNDPARSSEFDFAHLQVDDIERVEVLRGPQSAIYGSDAIGGVIVIRTKSGSGKTRTTVLAQSGSYDSAKVAVAVRGGVKKFNFAISASRFETEGFSHASEKRGATESDAYTNETLNLKFRFKPTETLSFDVVWRKTLSEADVDGYTGGVGAVDQPDKDKGDRDVGKLSAKLDLLDGRWTQKLNWAVSNFDVDSYTSGTNSYSTRGKKQKIAWQHNYVFAANKDHVLVALIEREKEQMFTTFSGGKRELTNLGYVLEYRFNVNKRFFSSLALRFDDNDVFKNASTGRLTLAYLLPNWKGARLHASVGTGVKNPTLFELYGSTASYTGNPNLEPEKAEGWDLGLEFKLFNNSLKLDVTYFDKDITNLIAGAGNTSINQPGVSKSTGVEIVAYWKINKQMQLTGSYTYLDAKKSNGEPQTRRPRHHLAMNVNYRMNNKSQLNLAVVSKAEIKDLTFDAFFNSSIVNLDDYTLVHVNYSYKFNKRFSVIAKVENLFDEDYEEVYTYGTSGRAGYITLKASF